MEKCASKSNVAHFLINPQCACAARVTLVGFVILSAKRHLTSRMSYCGINELVCSLAYEREKISGEFSEAIAFIVIA